MIRFYAPDIATSGILPESDSQHCIRVLRLTEGDVIHVVDGKGHLYICRIAGAHSKHTAVEIIDTISEPLPWRQEFTVCVAPTKHLDRMEWMVEKLTEIGVNRIIPLLCKRSERKEIKTERLKKIAVSAMKQSLKTVMPEIWEMTPVSAVIKDLSASGKFIAYCNDIYPRLSLAREYLPTTSAAILIGPEGDFTDDEVKLAVDNAWTPVSLGPSRLRTETAAITACDTFHIIDQTYQPSK